MDEVIDKNFKALQDGLNRLDKNNREKTAQIKVLENKIEQLERDIQAYRSQMFQLFGSKPLGSTDK